MREKAACTAGVRLCLRTDAESLALRRELEAAIGELPQKLKEPLVLREYEGMSYQEIADALAERPGRASMLPFLPLVRNRGTFVADPEELGHERAVASSAASSRGSMTRIACPSVTPVTARGIRAATDSPIRGTRGLPRANRPTASLGSSVRSVPSKRSRVGG